MSNKNTVRRAVIGLLGVLASGVAAALPLTLADGSVFYGFVSGGPTGYQLTLRADFTNTVAGSEFMGDRIESWSIQTPASATATLVSAPLDLGWSVYDTGKADPGGCNPNSNTLTVCVDRGTRDVVNGTGPLVTNTFFDWVVNVTFASPTAFSGTGNFHFLTVAWNPPHGRQPGEWVKSGGMISLPLDFEECVPNPSGGGCVPERDVPEPGTLALLGVGLLGLGLGKRNRVNSA